MIKTVIAVVVVLLVGVAAGIFTAQNQQRFNIGDLENQKRALKEKLEIQGERNDKINDLTKENLALRDRLSNLEDRMKHANANNESLRKIKKENASLLEALKLLQNSADKRFQEEMHALSPIEEAPGNGIEMDARVDEWERERLEGMQRDQERVAAMINAESESDALERLDTLQYYQKDNMELIQSLWRTETEEEREHIQQQLAKNSDVMNPLLQEQQEHMLHDLVKEYGVEDTQKRKKLVNAMRKMMHGPFEGVSGGADFSVSNDSDGNSLR